MKYYKKELKEKYTAKDNELTRIIAKYEGEKENKIKEFLPVEVEVQTEVDQPLIKKYYAAYDIHSDNKRYVINLERLIFLISLCSDNNSTIYLGIV